VVEIPSAVWKCVPWSDDHDNGRVYGDIVGVSPAATKQFGRKRLPKPVGSRYQVEFGNVFAKENLKYYTGFVPRAWSDDHGNGRVYGDMVGVSPTATKRFGRKRLPKPVGSYSLVVYDFSSSGYADNNAVWLYYRISILLC
ncbi:hypothetical protein Tco_1568175, partial [Tanacetum coccineum]